MWHAAAYDWQAYPTKVREITMPIGKWLLVFGCSVLVASLAVTQSAAQQPNRSDALPTLARVTLRCEDAAFCEKIGGVNEAYTELSRRGALPKVHTTYDQKVVEQAQAEIRAWWKQRGADVEVRTELTAIANTNRAALEFVVYAQVRPVEVHPDGTLFEPVQHPLPKYPKEAIRRQIQGDVRTEIRVSRADGLARVDSIRILSGDPAFADSIAQAICKWTFLEVPQREEGRISLAFQVTIHFTLSPEPFVTEN